MTKENWKKVSDAWRNRYITIELKVDGFDVSLVIEQLGMKLTRVIYINGLINGSNLMRQDDKKYSDIAIRFYRSSLKSLYTQKEIKETEKALGKRWAKKHNYYVKYESKHPDWTNFNSFKRHLVKHNKSIELIKA